MTTTQTRLKRLRQELRNGVSLDMIWEYYKNGRYTKKEIFDSLFMILNDKNKPSLRHRMLENQDKYYYSNSGKEFRKREKT